MSCRRSLSGGSSMRHDVQPVEEVLAETLGPHGLDRVLVRRRDDPGIHLDLRLGAEPPDDAVLEDAEKLRLGSRGHLRDLIEEDRALVGQLEAARPALQSARECALLVTEDLALEQRLRNGRAVHRHEGSVPPRGQLVQGARDQLLAGAALASDQHGGGRGRGQLDEAVDRLHGRAGPHQLADAPDLLDAPSEQRDLAGGLRPLDRLGHQQLEPGDVDGLRQKVVRALLHGGHRRVDAPLPAQQDDRREGQLFPEGAEQGEPILLRHHEVGDHDGRQDGARLVESLLAVRCFLRRIAPAGQETRKPLARRLVVVSDQDLDAHRTISMDRVSRG